MDQHLYKYLVLHKALYIPHLGSFSIEQVHARYDDMTGLLHSPRPVARFTEGASTVSQQPLIDFLANEMNVDEDTAAKELAYFAKRSHEQLSEEGSFTWKDVGTLTKETNGRTSFKAAHDLAELMPPIKQGEELILVLKGSGDAVLEETVDPDAPKDHWWYYALILLILGAGALLFYYN
jgi:hypothetical protein